MTDLAAADTIGGLVKGFAVLESFDTERQRLNATQAAERAGITRAAARRHLLTLTHLGYLESDGSHFWLSARVLRLAGVYLASARLPRLVQPALNRLAAATQEVHSVSVLDGAEVVIVARSGPTGQASRLIAYGMHLGARLPAYSTSTGRVLLAAMEAGALSAWLQGRQLPRLTPRTTTSTSQLRAVLRQVAQQDYCLAADENELGVAAVAVPLRNASGQAVAALNTIASVGRFEDPQALNDALAQLRTVALELRSML